MHQACTSATKHFIWFGTEKVQMLYRQQSSVPVSSVINFGAPRSACSSADPASGRDRVRDTVAGSALWLPPSADSLHWLDGSDAQWWVPSMEPPPPRLNRFVDPGTAARKRRVPSPAGATAERTRGDGHSTQRSSQSGKRRHSEQIKVLCCAGSH